MGPLGRLAQVVVARHRLLAGGTKREEERETKMKKEKGGEIKRADLNFCASIAYGRFFSDGW